MTEILFVIVLFSFLFIALLFLRKENSETERRLTEVINKELKEIRGSVDFTSSTMNEQISSFTKEATGIRKEMEEVQEVVRGISSFQEFFRSPKVRGQWGEANLKHLLQEYFPEELYSIQHRFSSGEAVDAVLRLPNKKLLPIDSKFPFDNFRRMVEAEGKEKELFRKKFLEDVKKRIREISEKYIIPAEDTVDFAVMYVPAEAVYYEINMSQDTDVAEFARSSKIILSSPNTFYLTLRAIEQWFRDTQITGRAHEVMKRLSRIEKDGEILTNEFRKMGIHIKNTVVTYKSSRKRVSLFDKRVKGILKNSKITTPEKKEN